jgi:SsrA-binding protein
MVLLSNKKARLEFEILDTYTAGVVLTGGEVKSLRNKSGSFAGSYVKIVGNEAVLLNAQITPYPLADNRDYDPKRTRKLLLKKKEIEDLADKIATKGMSLVPLSFEVLGRHIKLKFGLARGKKQFERRAELKKRDQLRDIQHEMKNRVKIH